VFTARKLLVLGTATTAKKVPDRGYVHCRKMLFALESQRHHRATPVSHRFAGMDQERTRSSYGPAMAGNGPTSWALQSAITAPTGLTTSFSLWIPLSSSCRPSTHSTALHAPWGASGLRGRTTDLSIAKEFSLASVREEMSVEFRIEARNAFNHPVFGTPNTSVDYPKLGDDQLYVQHAGRDPVGA
jgi:hypothetical protein